MRSAFGSDDKIIYRVCGNTKLTYPVAKQAMERYKPGRRLVYMIEGPEEDEYNTPEKMQGYKEWRWSVFRALRELTQRSGIIIRIRYTPYREMQFRAEEIPILKECGFEISESVPSNLLEDFCSDMAIMSTCSSVIATAELFGRIVYRVEYPPIDYVPVDDFVRDVKIKDIPDIVLPEGYEPVLAPPDAFFMIDKLLEPKPKTEQEIV